MIIRKMTATFGKLENQQLTLEPGLNVIPAPNEWGKSTWCAFLAAMLYGIDTRAKTTRSQLADKERFAPWSGRPMEGRMEVQWMGKEITIERHTKGRTPLGEFRAYETESGLPVPELTAQTCGEALLGVERSVFLRSGFLRLADLPVTEDEALRRRLNALVTTGEESAAGQQLADSLKELKNKISYHKKGLLPQAEQALSGNLQKQQEVHQLQNRMERCRQEQQEGERLLQQLRNHQAALEYEQAQKDAALVQAARERAADAAQRLTDLEQTCRALPALDELEEMCSRMNRLQQKIQEPIPDTEPDFRQPVCPAAFSGLTPQEAVVRSEQDWKQYDSWVHCSRGGTWWLGAVLPGVAMLMVGLWNPKAWIFAAAGVLLLIGAGLYLKQRKRSGQILKKMEALLAHYGTLRPEQWVQAAKEYEQAWFQWNAHQAQVSQVRREDRQYRTQLLQQLDELTGGEAPEEWERCLREKIRCYQMREQTRQEAQQEKQHLSALEAMCRTAQRPRQPDSLTWNEAQTREQLASQQLHLRQLQQELGQYQGRLETIGTLQPLEKQEQLLRGRIEKLNRTFEAAELALETLEQTQLELQRRFAPRIAARACQLMGRLTDGRYDRLNLTEDLTVHAGAVEEGILRPARWRSDGTVDQLYLALRLAVAEELTPRAPLVLDDALVRFDDDRVAKAMEILKEISADKQIILFTCQMREQNCLEKWND